MNEEVKVMQGNFFLKVTLLFPIQLFLTMLVFDY